MDFSLTRGENRSVSYALFDSAGAAFNLTGYTVTMAIDAVGRGLHTTKVGINDAPATLGTGVFAFAAADFTALRPGDYKFCIWAHNGSVELPMLVGTFSVVDVPQRL
jgi:hypothetical protein